MYYIYFMYVYVHDIGDTIAKVQMVCVGGVVSRRGHVYTCYDTEILVL